MASTRQFRGNAWWSIFFIVRETTSLCFECGAQPIAAFKWFMSQIAVECGPVRLPLIDPTSEQLATLRTKLASSGVWEWIPARRGTAAVA